MQAELGGIAPDVIDAILAAPLHRACELAVVRAVDGQSELLFQVNDFTANIQGKLHGGILYAMVDVACFMAMVSRLGPGQHGVTVDIQVSVLRPAALGETVVVRGRADRVGRTLANLRAEAWARGADGVERMIGTGTVLKSISVSAGPAG
jgi:uncharacterized protein (TIGR00369 family)